VIQLVGPLEFVQVVAQTGEVVGTLSAQMINATRRPEDEGLTPLVLAVQQAKRVALQPAPAVLAELAEVRMVVRLQGLQVGGTAGRAADAVELQV